MINYISIFRAYLMEKSLIEMLITKFYINLVIIITKFSINLVIWLFYCNFAGKMRHIYDQA